ncbi:MAG: hypothetical protein QXP58_07690 [Thermoprotei archaeon]
MDQKVTGLTDRLKNVEENVKDMEKTLAETVEALRKDLERIELRGERLATDVEWLKKQSEEHGKRLNELTQIAHQMLTTLSNINHADHANSNRSP